MRIRIPNLNWWMVSTFVLLIILVVSLTQSFNFTGKFLGGTTQDDIAKKTADFINENLVAEGTSITVVSVEEISGMYKITTDYRGTEIPVFVTKDGSYMFLEGFEMNVQVQESETTTTQQTTLTCDDVQKSDEPVLEAYVVSYCPYGLQMQRVLTKIAEDIPSLADNIKIRYIGAISGGQVQAMHGEEEAQENLRQICIREEQSSKYWTYLESFMQDGNYESALQTAKIDKTKLDECMTDPDKGLKYAEEDFTKADQFGVRGSPTLIINNQGQISEFDFGGRTAEAVKSVLCCGFSTEPSDCSKTLDQSQANAGFTPDYSGTGGTGSC